MHTSYPQIDARHMDIQGEELSVVPSIMKFATLNVRRMHVETHTREIDATLPALFYEYGWIPRFQFPCETKAIATPFEVIDFQGGVQSSGKSKLAIAIYPHLNTVGEEMSH